MVHLGGGFQEGRDLNCVAVTLERFLKLEIRTTLRHC